LIVREGKRSTPVTKKLDARGENVLEPSWRGLRTMNDGGKRIKVIVPTVGSIQPTNPGVPVIVSEPIAPHLLDVRR